MYYLNLVEWFKKLFKALTKNKENKIRNIHISIDLFIILKFLLIVILWRFKISNTFCEILVWYLIITNLFTYFYYHTWLPPFQDTNESKRRRFINLIISFIFSNLCFAYLYSEFYFDYYTIETGCYKELSSLLFSSFTSLFATYDLMKPKGDLGFVISLIQLSFTFFFISIILAGSIPQLQNKK
jgi:hypothetical protein